MRRRMGHDGDHVVGGSFSKGDEIHLRGQWLQIWSLQFSTLAMSPTTTATFLYLSHKRMK